MLVTVIDNYDSFTYNLVQYFGDLKADARVYRNDQVTAQQVLEEEPDAIVISPGPSDPDHAGICLELIRKTAETDIPLFGVCLGLQSMAQAFGGRVVRAPKPMHGKTSMIAHEGKTLFKGLPNPLEVTRYHSLIAERETLADCLEITAETQDGLIMGLSHRTKPVHGVQFHPESIATTGGHALIRNFLDMAG